MNDDDNNNNNSDDDKYFFHLLKLFYNKMKAGSFHVLSASEREVVLMERDLFTASTLSEGSRTPNDRKVISQKVCRRVDKFDDVILVLDFPDKNEKNVHNSERNKADFHFEIPNRLVLERQGERLKSAHLGSFWLLRLFPSRFAFGDFVFARFFTLDDIKTFEFVVIKVVHFLLSLDFFFGNDAITVDIRNIHVVINALGIGLFGEVLDVAVAAASGGCGDDIVFVFDVLDHLGVDCRNECCAEDQRDEQ